jgi:hypothetical protein
MTTERKLLPLPPSGWGLDFDGGEMQDYALANMAPLEAEIARLRAALEAYERLYLSPTEPPSASQCNQQMNAYDLIACPCCGGRATIIGTLKTCEWSAICTMCGLETAHMMQPKDAASAWNKRHAPDEEGDTPPTVGPAIGIYSIDNARLIAAAPELLAALQGMVGVLEPAEGDFTPQEQIAIDDARAAIDAAMKDTTHE